MPNKSDLVFKKKLNCEKLVRQFGTFWHYPSNVAVTPVTHAF